MSIHLSIQNCIYIQFYICMIKLIIYYYILFLSGTHGKIDQMFLMFLKKFLRLTNAAFI